MVKKALVVLLTFLLFVGGILLFLVLSGSDLNIENLHLVEDVAEDVVNDFVGGDDREEEPDVDFRLTFANITPGKEILIEEVTTATSGFVVVYLKDDTQRGDIFAVSKLFKPGVNKNVAIELPRQIFRGEQFFVMLHNDNGDGNFGEPMTEDIPMMEYGDLGLQPIVREIQVQQ